MKTIIFDFFGVVASDVYIIWMKNNGLENQIPQIIRDHFYRSDLGEISESDLYARLGSLVNKTPEQVWTEVKEIFQPVNEVIKLIESLKSKYKIVLCSNAPKGVVERFIEEHKLNSLFDYMIVSSALGVRKPYKTIFDITLNSVGATPQETLFIDDNNENVESAGKFGIKGIVFTSTESLKADLSQMGIL